MEFEKEKEKYFGVTYPEHSLFIIFKLFLPKTLWRKINLEFFKILS